MPRQVLSPIDLRTQAQRQGITSTQQTVQAIANILQTVGKTEQKRRERQTLDRITRAIAGGATTIEAISAVAGQGPEFGTGIPGALQKIGGMFQPSPGGMGQNIQQAIIGQQIKTDPLEREHLRERIGATKALTKQRQEATKQELPDRMLRQADRWLRIVDDVMSEYWYTPEGPYKDKLLKDAQRAREKAIKLIEKYGATSEAGKASLQQVANLDEQIKSAGGTVSTPKPQAKGRFYRGSNITKEQFESTYRMLKTPEQKQAYINDNWRPEFGRHIK